MLKQTLFFSTPVRLSLKLKIILHNLALLSISKYNTLYLLSPMRYPTTIVLEK